VAFGFTSGPVMEMAARAMPAPLAVAARTPLYVPGSTVAPATLFKISSPHEPAAIPLPGADTRIRTTSSLRVAPARLKLKPETVAAILRASASPPLQSKKLVPRCRDSHDTAGGWLLANVMLRAKTAEGAERQTRLSATTRYATRIRGTRAPNGRAS